MLWRGVRCQPVLKTLGISAFMTVFFVAYFHLLRHPAGPVTAMPLTALDRAIAFQPGAFIAYASLWVYVGLAPGLMLRLRDAAQYGLWAGALCVSGLALFYLWPTAVPLQAMPADLAHYPGFEVLQGVDAAGNACPSLHVATAVFAAAWLHRLVHGAGAPRLLQAANWIWLGLIAYSTLAIKQHVVLDVLAGALLGAAFAALSLRCHRGIGRLPARAEPPR